MSEVLRVALVDDEPLAISRLRLALAETPDVEVVATAADGAATLRLLEAGGIDVVLLDIRMPGLSGIDLLRALPRPAAPVFIFVTAFSRFAADAFELAAVDYLLKPVTFDRLREALARARQRLHAQAADSRIAELESVLAALRADDAEPPEVSYIDEIWAPHRGDRVRVPVDLIDWIEAERDYVRIHSRGRSFLLRRSIRQLQSELDPAAFLRVHRGALVRRDRIVRVARRLSGPLSVVLQTGAEIPVARRQAAAVRRQMSAAPVSPAD